MDSIVYLNFRHCGILSTCQVHQHTLAEPLLGERCCVKVHYPNMHLAKSTKPVICTSTANLKQQWLVAIEPRHVY